MESFILERKTGLDFLSESPDNELTVEVFCVSKVASLNRNDLD